MSHVETVLLLVAESGQAFSRAWDSVMGDAASADNYSVIALVTLHQRGSMRPMEIARLTTLTSGGVTKMIDRWEAGGLVTRGSSPGIDDARAVSVAVTSSGSELAERVLAVVAQVIERLFDNLVDMQAERCSLPS